MKRNLIQHAVPSLYVAFKFMRSLDPAMRAAERWFLESLAETKRALACATKVRRHLC
jgi:hypothetical protein